MKNTAKKLCIYMLAICLLITGSIITMPKQTQAAVKLNKTKITMLRYHQYQLKLSGTKAKVTWKSADKAVAEVTKKGKVTAISQGETTITATVGKKKYSCKVTVMDFDRETMLGGYGYYALQKLVPDSSTIKLESAWLGSTPDNVPFGMFECTFKDKSGKEVHTYIYTYEQTETSTTGYNLKTQYYTDGLVMKFDRNPMGGVQQTRVKSGSMRAMKDVAELIGNSEKVSITKGENFNVLCNWVNL